MFGSEFPDIGVLLVQMGFPPYKKPNILGQKHTSHVIETPKSRDPN